MKNISLSFSLVIWLFLPGRLLAQVYCAAPDFMAAHTYKAVYFDYVSELSSKIFSGEVEVYTDPSLTNPLPTAERAGYLTETYEMEDIDPYTGAFVLLVVRDTLRGSNWQGIHFGLTYISIKVNDYKFLYLPNKEKSKLNKQQNGLLEKLQSEAQLEQISFESIGEKAHLVYDALQKRIFDGIRAGKLPIYRIDSAQLPMNLTHFDTAYTYTESFMMEEEWGEGIIQLHRTELTAASVTGSCLLVSLIETSDGWHLECAHYGITYNPVFAGMELPPQPMCWIKREDLESFLTDEDWLFLEELWGFTLREKLGKPIYSTDF